MDTIKNRLRINVGFIINATVGYNRDFPFEFEKYSDDDLDLRQVDGRINIGRTPQGLIVMASFEGITTLECVKCLSNFEKPIKWEFTELYSFKEENITESGLLVPEDAQIDFRELFREYALLEYPILPVCKETCKGLCLECGQNLNLAECGHQRGPGGPLSELQRLLDK